MNTLKKGLSKAILVALFSSLLLSACNPVSDNPNQDVTNTPDFIMTDETSETSGHIPKVEFSVWKDSIPDKCTSRYGYLSLDASEKEIYNSIVEGAKNYSKEIEISREIKKERLEEICEMIFIEENSLYYLSDEYTVNSSALTGKVTSVVLDYKYDFEELAYLNTMTEEKVAEILSKTDDSMSDVDKLKIFHDEIIFGCKYETEGRYVSTPFGALVEGKALCEGYARAMAILCNKSGIENMLATGTQYNSDGNGNTTEEAHMWNMIKLDGEWYNMDVTWDDPASIKDGRELPDDYISYSYFLIPNNELRPTLSVRTDLIEPPAAHSLENNYFVYYGYYAESYDEALDILEKAIKDGYERGDRYVRIKFSTPALYKEAAYKLFSKKEIFTVCPDMLPKKMEFYWNENAKCIQFSIR